MSPGAPFSLFSGNTLTALVFRNRYSVVFTYIVRRGHPVLPEFVQNANLKPSKVPGEHRRS